MEVLKGQVQSAAVRIAKSNRPYAVFSVIVPGRPSSVTCKQWNTAFAPEPGAEVEVRGEWSEYQGQQQLIASAWHRLTPAVASSSPLYQRLLRYFHDYVEEESSFDLRMMPGNRNSTHALLEQGHVHFFGEPETCKTRITLPNEAAHWARNQIRSRKEGRVQIGWPLVVGQFGGRTEYAPLFFHDAQLHPVNEPTEGDDEFLLETEEATTALNPKALMLLGIETSLHNTILDAVEPILAATDQSTRLNDACGAANQIIGSDPPVLVMPPDRFLGAFNFSASNGFPAWFNTAVLFDNDSAIYTRGLLAELKELLACAPREWQATAAGQIFADVQDAPLPAALAVPAVMASNLSQDRAAGDAFGQTVTVVTGPPGTGKSQVLVNVVATALQRGETVLVASRNNQAVDVVLKRIAEQSPIAEPLRTGNRRYHQELQRTIKDTLAQRTTWPRELQQLDEDWTALSRELLEIHEVRHKRLALEAELAQLDSSRMVLERALPSEILQIADVEASRAALAAWERAHAGLLNAQRSCWPCVLFSVGSRKIELQARTSQFLDTLPQPAHQMVSEDPLNVDVERWRRLFKQVVEHRMVTSYFQAAESQLKALPSDLALERRLSELQPQRKEVGRKLFKRSWWRLHQSAPHEIRTATANYASNTARGLDLIPKVLKMFPVWGLTTLSVRKCLPLRPGLFDLVVIDEASQCDIASALPLLFRAKRALIIGDPMQLRHITRIKRTKDEALALNASLKPHEHHSFNARQRSLFDLGNRLVNERPVFLNQHFRSRPDIISFSNTQFYGSKMVAMRPESGLPAMIWQDTPGQFGRLKGKSALNRPEAEQVASLVQQNAKHWARKGWSVGVVTPFRAQKDLIGRLIKANDEEELTIDTAHRFQGDERDVMLLSPVVSAAMPELLGQFSADQNLLNVALTRAREQVIVVGDRTACMESGGLLGDLASYIEDLMQRCFRSPGERRLFDGLVKAGIEVIPSHGVSGYELDLAIEPDGRKIAIECDGWAVHADRRKRDQTRQRRLEFLGWTFVRFGYVEIRDDLERCVARVRAALKDKEDV